MTKELSCPSPEDALARFVPIGPLPANDRRAT